MRQWLILVAFIFSIGLSPAAFAEHTRVTHPNAVSLEILGRGMFGTLNFDRVMTDELAAGLGVGTIPAITGIATGTATLFPVYANYYFMKDAGSIYATAGITIALVTGSATFDLTGVSLRPIIPQIGVGYENRGDSGFLFRAAVYALYSGTFGVWGGISFGYAF